MIQSESYARLPEMFPQQLVFAFAKISGFADIL
jgi:hypothetical protein